MDIGDEGDTNDEDMEECEGESEHHSRAKRHSKTPYGAGLRDATQLQFYPSSWVEALTTAKRHWRMYLVAVWAWPKIRKNKDDIKECLTRAIAEYEAEGGVLDKGALCLSFKCNSL